MELRRDVVRWRCCEDRLEQMGMFYTLQISYNRNRGEKNVD
jgi:hypothetical protein